MTQVTSRWINMKERIIVFCCYFEWYRCCSVFLCLHNCREFFVRLQSDAAALIWFGFRDNATDIRLVRCRRNLHNMGLFVGKETACKHSSGQGWIIHRPGIFGSKFGRGGTFWLQHMLNLHTSGFTRFRGVHIKYQEIMGNSTTRRGAFVGIWSSECWLQIFMHTLVLLTLARTVPLCLGCL